MAATLTFGSLNLIDGTNYKARTDSLLFVDGVLTLTLAILGSSTDTLATNYRAVWDEIRKARQGTGPYGVGTPSVVTFQPHNASNPVYFDVRDGTLAAPPWPGTVRSANALPGCVLTLVCEPFARGAAITDTVSATLTNGDGAPLYRADVPGDVPALCRLTLSDVSTGTVIINRFRVGVRGLASMASGDFDPILDETAVSPGVSGAEAGTVGGNRTRLTSATPAWQSIAKFESNLASTPYNTGLFRAFVRARTTQQYPGKPTSLASSQNGSGTLPTGTYVLRVAAITTAGTIISAASEPIHVVVRGTESDRIALTWTVPTSGGTVNNHRVYWSRDGGAWTYKDTGSATGSYNLDNETGGTAGEPSDEPSTGGRGELRLRLALSSGTTYVDTDPASFYLSNSVWELLDMGLVALPPQRALEAGTPLDWDVLVQGRHLYVTGTNFDVDALYLFPVGDWESSTQVEYPNLTLATKRDWIIDTTRDGAVTAYLVQTGTSTEAGQVNVTSPFYLPPGDCLLVFSADITDGDHDVVDAKFTVVVRLVPRYRLFRGS